MTGAFLPRPKRSGYPAQFYDETHSEFLKRVEKIALKKMYILGTSILEGVGVVDDEMEKIC